MEQQPFQNPAPGYYSVDLLEKRRDRLERKNLSRLGMAIFIYMVFTSLVQTAMAICGNTFFPQYYNSTLFKIALQVVPSYLLGIPLFRLLLTGMPRKTPEKKSLKWGDWIGFIAVAFFLMILGSLISSYLIDLLEGLKQDAITNSTSEYISESSNLMNLIVVVILAPICEELIFRKWLIDRLLPYSEIFAILTSSLIFGLVHGNFYQFFYAALLGGLFALVYTKTGKLRYTIVMHMIINFTGSIIANFLNQALDGTMETTGSLDLWGLLASAYSMAMYVLAACGIALLIIGIKRIKLSATGNRELSLNRQFRLGWINAGMILTGAICLLSFVASIFLY